VSTLDTLLKKAADDKLAHFYIVESSSQGETQEILMDFVHSFIRSYYQQVEYQKASLDHLMDHPDVYVLGIDEARKESTAYTVLEAEALSRFFEFRPVQSKRKFVVIAEAHRMSSVISNKWLKLLEEPQGQSTIFLLNAKRMKLLDTIHSRAIHLRLPSTPVVRDHSAWTEMLGVLGKMTLSEFIEEFSRGEMTLNDWVTELVQWESEQISSPESKTHLMEWLKTLAEMEVFHQPTATKWTLFYSYLKDHVLPRLKGPSALT
jgi:DNA polymerase-3 subunit delta'